MSAALDMINIERKHFCYQLSLWLLLQSIVTLVLFYYVGSKWLYNPNPICSFQEINSSVQSFQVIILLWTFAYNELYLHNQCLKLFGTTGCFYTTDRMFYKRADAVLFHHSDIMHNLSMFPQEPRPTYQRWIWFNLEPPSRIKKISVIDELMNLTMTYRRDSDIFTPYGSILLNKRPQTFTIPPKFKLVAWLSSNWDQKMRRVHCYNELKKYLQIDVFGQGNLPLGRAEQTSVLSQYKFYLAFEDYENQDYITDELWNNALLSGTVPVVLGPTRENYEHFLPAEAFIHVDDFPSAKELAEYLLMLDKDDKKYQKYFTWRSRYEVVGNIDQRTHYCKACHFLLRSQMYRTIPSVVNWFTGS